MKKEDIHDILLDLLSDTLPYCEVRKVNQTITEGHEYHSNLKKLESTYKQNNSLKQKLAFRSDIKKSLVELDEIEDLKKQLNQLGPKRKIAPFVYLKWSIAATIALLMVFGIALYNQPGDVSPEKLYSSYYSTFSRKEINYKSESDLLKLAREKYNNGLYGEAIALFSSLPKSIDIESEKLFYLGLSHMELKQFNDAIVQFEEIFEHYPRSAWANPSYWYLALACLNTGRVDQAAQIFEDIAKGKYYNDDKARKIIKKLK